MRSYTLLGTFSVTDAGAIAPIMKHQKGLALLAYLIVANQTTRREVVSDMLWEATSTKQSLANLRALLPRIRKLVPELGVTRQTVTFTPTPTTRIDLVDLLAALTSDSVATTDAGLNLYRGDLLDGFYLLNAPRFNEWLVVERERLRSRVLDSYRRVCRHYEQGGMWEAGIDATRRWLALDAFDTEPLRLLMLMLARQGQTDQALQQYEASRRLHHEKLGVDLDAITVDLAQRIEAGAFTPVLATGSSRFWDETPNVTTFFGRSAELAQLNRWISAEKYPAVAICGIGGVGKTTLAATAVRALGKQFDAVLWRSLLNAPRLDELLPDMLRTLSNNRLSDIPNHLDGQLSLLLTLLRNRRCLLVLDNVESIMADNSGSGFQPAYSAYARLLQFVAEQDHHSHLLITSREIPRAFARLTGASPRVGIMSLTGLDSTVGRELLNAQQLDLDESAARTLVLRYSGNPLALNLVAQTVQDLYAGDIDAFLAAETLIFDTIRDVLDQQYDRLSSLEQELLFWLVIAREPLTPTDLQTALVGPVRLNRLLEALHTLRRRSLLEQGSSGFTLQNVVIEYLTNRLVEQVVDGIRGHSLPILKRHALQQAQARSYIRRIQARLILQPIAEQLQSNPGTNNVGAALAQLLHQLRRDGQARSGYAAGNILNLLLHMELDPRGFDFSHLNVWQADLQNAFLPNVNFAGADLATTTFADTFSFIYSVAFSPDGQLLAAGAADGRVRVWQRATGKPLLRLHGNSDGVWSILFSPDGRTLVTTGADRHVRLWNLESLQAVDAHRRDYGINLADATLKGHEGGVHAAAFNRTGNLLATSSEDRSIIVWDVAARAAICRLTGHDGQVETVTFSPDGQYLVSGGRDQSIRLWHIGAELNGGQPSNDGAARDVASTVLGNFDGWVSSVAFSPDGRMLATGVDDGTVHCWLTKPFLQADKAAPQTDQRRTFLAHSAGVKSVAFSPNGQTLASGGNDQTIRLWNVASGRVTGILQGHTNWVRSVKFSPDGRWLASGSWDHSVRLWRTSTGQEQRQFRGFGNQVFSVTFSPDGRTIATGSADKRVRLWSMSPTPVQTGRTGQHEAMRQTRTFKGNEEWVWEVVFSPDGTTLASAGMDRVARLWHVASGRLIHTLRGHDDGLQSIAFSPDGRTLATGGLDGAIVLWDAEFGRIRARLTRHTGWVLGLSFSPDGRWLLSASSDQTVRLWPLDDPEAMARNDHDNVLYTHADGLQQVTFSPNGRLIASGGWDKVVKIWDVARAKLRFALRGHTDIVRPVAFSPDGQTLLSGSNDRTIRLWDVASGRSQAVFEGHGGLVLSAEFSPDGRYIVSASADETIKLWEVDTGRCVWTREMPKPYAGMNISGATGLTIVQKATLKSLGAVE